MGVVLLLSPREAGTPVHNFYFFTLTSFVVMNNLTLRIMRSWDEASNGPEYARNLLIANLPTDSLPDYTRELSIRVYSELYQLLGTDVWQKPNGRKMPRKISFRLPSNRDWSEACCHLFLYFNGRPRWYASCSLPSDYGEWGKIVLEPLADHPDELFFVEHLCHQSWWYQLEQGRFPATTIHDLIAKLRLRTTNPTPWPHLFVAGDEAQADLFAANVLATYLSGNTPPACCRFALNDLLSGELNWWVTKDYLADMKVLIVQVDPIRPNKQGENILTFLTDWFKAPGTPTCIFHGSSDSLDRLKRWADDISELIEEKTTFDIPATRDTPDEPHIPLPDVVGYLDFRLHKKEGEAQKTSEANQKLESLIGLDRLKTDLHEASLLARFTQARKRLGIDTDSDNRYHMIFYGNPGTGKTTVARLVGEIYHDMGLLSSGHTVEVCRSGLVGEYIGHTESRMKEILEQARGGVLFIDEAYTLVSHNRESNDFGKEVIHALLPVLSEPNPDMIVILAGYEEKMQTLLRSNPGLKERFPLKFYFDDYSADELYEIALRLLHKRKFVLTCEAGLRLKKVIAQATAQRDENFGNGRWVHNLVEQGIVKSMARRIMTRPGHDCSDRALLCTIEPVDIDEAEERISIAPAPNIPQPIHIGFRA